MKPEDERVLQTWCAGKVIERIDFPTPATLQIWFAGHVGIEISEPPVGAKGLVVRIIHPASHPNSAR